VDRARLRAAARFATAWLDANEARHGERARRGRFREGHGDLRLEHVVFEDGIVVFDCVEFDPALRRIDVAADLAFLVMELHEAGAADLAAELVSAYREAGGDPGGDELLSFYAAYRALVRAKLHYLRPPSCPRGRPNVSRRARPAIGCSPFRSASPGVRGSRSSWSSAGCREAARPHSPPSSPRRPRCRI
jgi:uncharacterized protein